MKPYVPPTISTMSRPEWIADIPWADNQALTVPFGGGIVPNDRFYYALLLMFEGRFTQPASGNASGVQADGPFSIMNLVTLQGFHRLRGQQEQFINARPADLYNDVLWKSGRAPLSMGTLSTTASATSDIRFVIPIIFPPIGVRPSEQLGYLLDAPNYDRLQMVINSGDAKSIFTGQTGTITESAYGSSTGTPRIRVFGIYAQAGAGLFNGFIPARVWRYYQEVSGAGSVLASTATQVPIFQLPAGNFMRSILLKSGVVSTGTTAGNTAYNSLSDTILANIKVNRGLNKTIVFDSDFFLGREAVAGQYKIVASNGYMPIDWCPNNTLATLFNATQLVAGPAGDTSFQLVADIAGAANQGAVVLYEELRGQPINQ